MREAFRGLKSMQSCDGAVTMSEMSVSSRAEGSICQDRAPGCSQGKVGAGCPCHNQTFPFCGQISALERIPFSQNTLMKAHTKQLQVRMRKNKKGFLTHLPSLLIKLCLLLGHPHSAPGRTLAVFSGPGGSQVPAYSYSCEP